MSQPIFHLLAGPNGAGKSTLYRALVDSGTIGGKLEFVNADLYERDHLQHIADPEQRSEAAREWADRRRAELLDAKVGFVSETVFSHESKDTFIFTSVEAGIRTCATPWRKVSKLRRNRPLWCCRGDLIQLSDGATDWPPTLNPSTAVKPTKWD